jgi:serine/threonine protein kinase
MLRFGVPFFQEQNAARMGQGPVDLSMPAAHLVHRLPAGTGRTLGPYRLLRELGRGSMGVVHLALDVANGQHVALKTLSLGHEFPGGEFDDARARFLGEVQAAKRLSHPDIVTVFAAGEHNGTVWLAMELLRGCDLVRYTRGPRLLPETLVLGSPATSCWICPAAR